MKSAVIASLALLMFVTVAPAQNSTPDAQSKTPPAADPAARKTIAQKTIGLQKLPGFFT